MTKKDKQLIMDLALKKIKKSAFLSKYTVNPEKNPDHVISLFEEAYKNKIDDEVEYAIILGSIFSFPPSSYHILNRLIVEEWHYKHEDIARTLQDFKRPESISFLYQAALTKFKYLEYDDCRALIKKCIWALCDIGTEEAIEKIKELSRTDNNVVVEEALYRLNKMKQ